MTLRQEPIPDSDLIVPPTPYYLEGAARELLYGEQNARWRRKLTNGEHLLAPLLAAGELSRQQLKDWIGERTERDPKGKPVRRDLIQAGVAFRERVSAPYVEQTAEGFALNPDMLPEITPTMQRAMIETAIRRWLADCNDDTRANFISQLQITCHLDPLEAEVLEFILAKEGTAFYTYVRSNPELTRQRKDACWSLLEKLNIYFDEQMIWRTPDCMGFYACPSLLLKVGEISLREGGRNHLRKFDHHIPVPMLLSHRLSPPKKNHLYRHSVRRSRAILTAHEYLEEQGDWAHPQIRQDLRKLLEQFPEATPRPSKMVRPSFLKPNTPPRLSREAAWRAAHELFRISPDSE